MSLTRVTKKKLEGIPASVTEMEAMALGVLEKSREREKLVMEREAEVARVIAPYTEKLTALDADIQADMSKLEMWAEVNRQTFGEGKSIEIAGTHRIGWRLGNWKTKPAKGRTWKAITDTLLELVSKGSARASEMLRTKTEPDKEAMLALRSEPEAAEVLAEVGVDVEQEETFYLE